MSTKWSHFNRHNEIYYWTAKLFNKIYYDVAAELPLQSISSKIIVQIPANRQDVAHADIHSQGFLELQQGTILVFMYPNAPT